MRETGTRLMGPVAYFPEKVWRRPCLHRHGCPVGKERNPRGIHYTNW